jgi:hypothetical protein
MRSGGCSPLVDEGHRGDAAEGSLRDFSNHRLHRKHRVPLFGFLFLFTLSFLHSVSVSVSNANPRLAQSIDEASSLSICYSFSF